MIRPRPSPPLHFIGRKPDLAVNDLLQILKITKQSLGAC